MFADNTNFFYSHHQIKTFFETVNCELKNISQWFRANKLSLNIKKTKYTLFFKYLTEIFYRRQNSFKIASIENGKQSNRENTIHKSLRSDVG